MKKIIKFLFTFIFTFILFNLKINADTSCVNDFKDRTCDFSVGIGNKCSGISYSKAYKGYYTDVYNVKREVYAFCYNAGQGKYFYELVLDSYSKCKRSGKVFVKIGKNNPNRPVITHDMAESISILGTDDITSQEVGCAPYFFYSNDNSKAVFSYSRLKEYDWFPSDNLDFTITDNESAGKIKTCVANKLSSNSFCTSSNKKSFVSDSIDKCMKEQGLAYEKDSEAYTSLIGTLKKEFDSDYMSTVIYNCEFQECGVSQINIAKYFSAQLNNSAYSTETLMRNAGFTDEQISCAIEKINSQDTKNDINDATSAAGEQVDSTMEDIQNDLPSSDDKDINVPDGWKISDEDMTCEELLGSNLTKVVHVGVTAIRVIGALITIVFGILTYVPAVTGDDPELLKKANSKAIKMGIILIIILLLPTLVKIIGNIFDFDLTCLM